VNLIDLETFVRVVERGSFTAAAEALGVPKSTVSRRVQRLERALGAELLTRKARSFVVAPPGEQLFARCAPALTEIASARRSLTDQDGAPDGLLRLTATTDLGSTQTFAEMLAGFRRTWPGVRLDVYLTQRRVDLVEEGFDIAIRAHGFPLPDSSSLMTRRLVTTHGGLFASQAYLDGAPRIRSPRDLAKHPCLCPRVGALGEHWPLHKGDDEPTPFEPNDVFRSNDFSVILRMAIAGAGVAILPRSFAQPHVEEGALVRVLPRWQTSTGAFSLLWPASRFPAPRVRAFIDYAAQHFQP
jgi:DNA-binding transcriptional LysR family regulator